MNDYSFGNFLHELRSHRGLTQYQLGALVGVSDKAVSKWENGSSKPQSSILFKLGEVLGISIDELMSCKYNSYGKNETKGVFAMKKELWRKVFDAMRKRYGDNVPVEISNRLLTEQLELQDTDVVVYFDILSVLATEAKKQGEHIRVRGGTGASFVAYLMGATEINPLKPHYYCSKCRTVIFDNSVNDGWDLPRKKCSCGKEMQTDGHDIPFATYHYVVQRNTSFDVSTSPNYLHSAEAIIKEYFKDCDLTYTIREENRIITYTVSSGQSDCPFTFFAGTEFDRYKALERATATAFERIPFYHSDILREFRNGNTDGIPDFQAGLFKDMLNAVIPNSFRDLIQIPGMAHSIGAWMSNADRLVNEGIPIGKLIAYRDDVFNYIQEKMISKGIVDVGFAYRIMENSRKGIYAINGIPDDTKRQLKSIGMEDWFVKSIGKIRYLFPKAHGVTHTKTALILMWYKLNFPKEFDEIML